MNRHFRLAPTPSGFLHAGNLFNFLLTAKRCREASGTLRLRIDDLDRARVREEYIENIFTLLETCGIGWQEGPQNASEHAAHYRQQYRMDAYEKLLRQLVASGKVFACNCSRTQIALEGTHGRYSGSCLNKNLSLDSTDVAWRVDTRTTEPVSFSERNSGTVTADMQEINPFFVVRRRDGLPAYQVASLRDDLGYGITDIVRGKDLIESTFSQILLSRLLGGTAFEEVQFEHHELLLKNGLEKLSKTAGDHLLSTTPDDLSEQIAELRQQVKML